MKHTYFILMFSRKSTTLRFLLSLLMKCLLMERMAICWYSRDLVPVPKCLPSEKMIKSVKSFHKVSRLRHRLLLNNPFLLHFD